MIKRITLRQAGGSITATLPKEMAEKLNVQAGDDMFVVETRDGLLLTPYDPDFEKKMEAFEEFFKDYRNTLKKLGE